MTDETSNAEARTTFADRDQYVAVQEAVVKENIQFLRQKNEALQKYMFRFIAVPLSRLEPRPEIPPGYEAQTDNPATHYVLVTLPDETQSRLLPEINGSVSIFLSSEETVYPLPDRVWFPYEFTRRANSIRDGLDSAKKNALEALDKARHADGTSTVGDQDCLRVYYNVLEEKALDIFWQFVPSGVHESEEAAKLVRRLVRSENESLRNWVVRLYEFVHTTPVFHKPVRNEYGLPFMGYRIAPPPGVSTNAALFLVKVPTQCPCEHACHYPPLRYKFERDADPMHGTTREWGRLLESLNHSVTGIISTSTPGLSLAREILGIRHVNSHAGTYKYINYITTFEQRASELNFDYFESFHGMQSVQDELGPDEANILDGLRHTIAGKVHITGPTRRKTRLSTDIAGAVIEYGVLHKGEMTGRTCWNKGPVVWIDTDDDEACLTALRFSGMKLENKDTVRVVRVYDFKSEIVNFSENIDPQFNCIPSGYTGAKKELIDHIEKTDPQRQTGWRASLDRYSVSEITKQIVRNELEKRPRRDSATSRSLWTRYRHLTAADTMKVYDLFVDVLRCADVIVGTVAAFGSYHDLLRIFPKLLVVDNAHQYTESKMLTALGMFPMAPTIMAGSLEEPGQVSEMSS